MTSGMASAASVTPATTSRVSQARSYGRMLPKSESHDRRGSLVTGWGALTTFAMICYQIDNGIVRSGRGAFTLGRDEATGRRHGEAAGTASLLSRRTSRGEVVGALGDQEGADDDQRDQRDRPRVAEQP